jgi:hypothetical protein
LDRRKISIATVTTESSEIIPSTLQLKVEVFPVFKSEMAFWDGVDEARI